MINNRTLRNLTITVTKIDFLYYCKNLRRVFFGFLLSNANQAEGTLQFICYQVKHTQDIVFYEVAI